MISAFSIYVLLTLITTAYFFYNLYQKESQIFIFTLYIVKSKFHFVLAINFVVMLLVLTGKIIIKIFFNEIRESELIVNIFLNISKLLIKLNQNS
jgi:hypothetical protein